MAIDTSTAEISGGGVESERAMAPQGPPVMSIARLPSALQRALAHQHLPALDGFRMASALLVVFYHFGLWGAPGGLGVLTFFVISGFLITWLLLREEEKYGAISLRLFYARRTLRIFPAFYAFWLLLTAALLVFRKPIVWPQAMSALVYVNNYYQAIFGDPNTGYSHTWSLGVEEQFYLLWPLLLIALRRQRSRAIIVVACVILGVWIHRLVLTYAMGVWQGYIYEAFDTRLDHLMVGCLLALLLHGGYLSRLWRTLCRVWASVLTLGLLAISVRQEQIYGSAFRDVIGFAVDPLLVAVLIVQAMALRESPMWSWLNWNPVRYLGALSYSMYLYQQVLVHPVRKVLAHQVDVVQFIGVLIAVILAASASYHLIERPFLRLKDRASRIRSKPRPPSVGAFIAA